MDVEGHFVIELEENTVCPKSDIDAEEVTDNKTEENAVRPTSDMDAENKHENENWSSSSKKDT